MKNKNEIANRTWIVFAFICVIGLAIFGKIIYIQTAEASKWEERAQRYEQQVRDIEPTRGQIYSSDGSLLATSVPVYDVYWDSKSSAIDQEVFLAELDSLCIDLQNYFGDKSKSEYKQLLLEAQRKGDRYFRVKKNLKYTEMKVVREFHFIRRGKFKSGFIFDRKDIRKKPFGKLAARTIGIDRHGSRVGLELAYNEELAGKSGKQLMERIAGDVWKPVTDSYITPPEEGLDIVSTINVHLQDVAANALEKQLIKHNALWGTVVLMEVETGYIRAISNLSRDAETGEYHESFNYAVAETVEPGSTFKLASLMAAMDDGHVELEELVDTGIGVKYFSGEDMHDSNEKEGGNGIITAEQVFEKSSNIGTATLIDKYYKNNPQAFLDKLHKMGLGESLNIRLKGEKAPSIYKKAKEGNWSGVSLTQMSIGYEILQTPLQTLTFYNAVANNGTMVRPQFVESLRRNGEIVESFSPEIINKSICSRSTLNKCQKMMEGVCEEGGTADFIFADRTYKVAGKTGTARIAYPGGYYLHRYRASFVGYFPAEKPKYSILVLVNDTKSGVYYGSSIAGPVFRELADKIYATEFELHEENEQLNLVAEHKLPASRNGSREDLEAVYKSLKVPFSLDAAEDWVSTTTTDDHVDLKGKTMTKGLVPDVRGMGLQDALFLLENSGLRVQVSGSGTVRNQSILPGAQTRNHSTIRIELS